MSTIVTEIKTTRWNHNISVPQRQNAVLVELTPHGSRSRPCGTCNKNSKSWCLKKVWGSWDCSHPTTMELGSCLLSYKSSDSTWWGLEPWLSWQESWLWFLMHILLLRKCNMLDDSWELCRVLWPNLLAFFCPFDSSYRFNLHIRFQTTIIWGKIAYHQYPNMLNSCFEIWKSRMDSFKSIQNPSVAKVHPTHETKKVDPLASMSAHPFCISLKSMETCFRTWKPYLTSIQILQGVLNYEAPYLQ